MLKKYKDLFVLVPLLITLNAFLFFRNLTSNTFRFSELRTHPEKLIEEFGGGDKRWYLESGYSLALDSAITENFYWIINLWPPGMPILNGLILKYLPDVTYYTVSLMIINVILLTLTFIAIYIVIKKNTNIVFGLLVILIIYISTPTQIWILSPYMFYSDSYSVYFFILTASIVVFLMYEKKANSYNIAALAIGGGLFLAIAA